MSSAESAASTQSLAIARQPILDARKTIVGYELFDRSRPQQGHFTAASDAALLFNLLSNADPEVVQAQRPLFINCTHQTLVGGHLDLVTPDRVVLEIPPLPAAEPEDIETYAATLQEVHRRGFQLALDATALDPDYAAWLRQASFIKCDVAALTPQVLARWQQARAQQPGLKLVAERIETAAQFQQAQQAGAELFQGYWFARPTLVQGQTLKPAQANVIHLINLVRKQASTDEIEDVFKRDPTLSFNLLRFINSAGFGLRVEVTSFRHAVMLLGLKKLFRWAALLMTTAGAGGGSALGHAAVIRGRLMELLVAEQLEAESRDNAFVVGIFSLLDSLLGMPMKDALAGINLPDEVTQALLHGAGPLAPYLMLTLACENADDDAFATHALALGLTGDQINMAHLQALAWAENMAA